MNYNVTLYHREREEQATVVVDEVHYNSMTDTDHWVKLVGTDPHCYPGIVDPDDYDRSWFSKGPTLFLDLDDPIDVINVAPTDDSTPEPDLSY